MAQRYILVKDSRVTLSFLIGFVIFSVIIDKLAWISWGILIYLLVRFPGISILFLAIGGIGYIGSKIFD